MHVYQKHYDLCAQASHSIKCQSPHYHMKSMIARDYVVALTQVSHLVFRARSFLQMSLNLRNIQDINTAPPNAIAINHIN